MTFWPPYGVGVKDQREEYEHPSLRNVSVSQYLATFFAETSLQGFPQLVKQAGIIKKFLWLIGIVTCAFGLYWQFSSFIDDLVKWSPNTKVNVKTVQELYFPAVTICNNNPTWVSNANQLPPPETKTASRKKRGLINSLLHPPFATTQANLLSNLLSNSQQIVSQTANLVASSLISNTLLNTLGSVENQTQQSLVELTSSLLTLLNTVTNQTFSTLNEETNSLTDALSSITDNTLSSLTAVLTNNQSLTNELTNLLNTVLNTVTNQSLSTLTGETNDLLASALSPITNNALLSDLLTAVLVNNQSLTSPLLSNVVKTVEKPLELVLSQPASYTAFVVEQAMEQIYAKQDIISSCPYENREQLGHQRCDMIIGCRYNGVACNISSEFSTWHWNPVYGNCYTFNGGYKVADQKSKSDQLWNVKLGDDGSGIKISYKQGDDNGLYLMLNADLERYSENTSAVGWRIVIHNQTQMPFPEDGGIFVAPGTSTRIALSMISTERLGIETNMLYTAKYSDCLKPSAYNKNDPRNAYTEMMEVSYSTSACFKTCYQRAVMINCTCYDIGYPHTGSAFADLNNNGMDILGCNYTNKIEWTCKESVSRQFRDHSSVIDCDCPDSCSEIGYNYVVSHLKWPNYKAMKAICKNIKAVYQTRIDKSDKTCNTVSYIANDFLHRPGHGDDKDGQALFDELEACSNSTSAIGKNERPLIEQLSQATVASRFGEVYIYYKDFNLQTVEENENTSLQDLLGWTGGIVGLFFGFSMMTLFEYLQLVIDLICIFVAKICCRRSNENNGITKELMNSQLPSSSPSQHDVHLKKSAVYPFPALAGSAYAAQQPNLYTSSNIMSPRLNPLLPPA